MKHRWLTVDENCMHFLLRLSFLHCGPLLLLVLMLLLLQQRLYLYWDGGMMMEECDLLFVSTSGVEFGKTRDQRLNKHMILSLVKIVAVLLSLVEKQTVVGSL